MENIENAIIKNEFDHSYMLLMTDRQIETSYPLRMITQNRIPGFLACKIRLEEENVYCSYDVTSKKSLDREFANRKMTFQDLQEFLYGISRIMKSADEFLLPYEGFFLKPQYIYRDLETEELYCMYFPALLYQNNQDNVSVGKYRELADFLLDKTDHKDEHAVNTAYQFYKMSKEVFFSFEAFISFMEREELLLQAEKKRIENKKNEEKIYANTFDAISEYDNKKLITHETEKIKKTGNRVMLPAAIVLFVIGIIITGSCFFMRGLRFSVLYIFILGISLIGIAVTLLIRYLYFLRYSQEMNFPEEPIQPVTVEEYFDDILDSETVYFDEEAVYCLKWKEKHFSKEFYLSDFPVTVGKLKDSVQLCIEDESVSRLHARFKEQGKRIILQDLDSTNGTKVNGKALMAGEEIIIKRNDEIQFGKIVVNVV